MNVPPECLAELSSLREEVRSATRGIRQKDESVRNISDPIFLTPSPSAPSADLSASAFSPLRGWNLLHYSKQYTGMLPTELPDGTKLPFAFMQWDKEATRDNGTFDEARAIRSTRFVCHWCGGHIVDADRIWMDANGIWLPTQDKGQYHRSYQLSTFYTPQIAHDFDSSWAGMGAKIRKAELNGNLNGVINSDFAEAYGQQDKASGVNISLSKLPLARPEWIRLMTVDAQRKWPHYFFVIRAWSVYRLQNKFEIADGIPLYRFSQHGKKPLPDYLRETKSPMLAKLETVIGNCKPAWIPLAEILRVDPRDGTFPLIDYLIAQGLTGSKLVEYAAAHRVPADDMAPVKNLWRDMMIHAGHTGIAALLPRGGDSELLAAGHLDTYDPRDWTELHNLFARFDIGKGLEHTFLNVTRPAPREGVLIDSGFRERDNHEIRQWCSDTATEWISILPDTCRPSFKIIGKTKPCPRNNYVPYKGFPENFTMPDPDNGRARRPFGWRPFDPYLSTPQQGQVVIRTLCGATDHFWKRVYHRRQRQSPEHLAQGVNLHNISPKAEWLGQKGTYEHYKAHQANVYLDEAKDLVIARAAKGGKQHDLWPNDLADCENMQEALAFAHGLFES